MVNLWHAYPHTSTR